MATGAGGVYLNTSSGLMPALDALYNSMSENRKERETLQGLESAGILPAGSADTAGGIFDRLAKNFGLSNVGTGADYRKQNQPQSQGDQNSQSPALLPSPRAPQTPMAYSSAGDLSAAQKGIANIESNGGNFGAVGPVTKTGDRAYGAFQVMGANIPQWTQEALGRSLTPQEFLADPAAQKATFDHKFGQYVQKYGPEGAARAWFAGEGGMDNPNARDQLGTTVSSYGQRFMDSYAPAVQAINRSAPQGRLPVSASGGPTAYTSTGQPVATDARGNAIQAVPAPQAPAAGPQVPASPFGTLNAPPSAPDWKGMPAPAMAYAPQQQPSPAQAAPRQIPAQPVPTQQPAAPIQMAQAGGDLSSISGSQIQALVRNPQTRQMGLALWQARVLGKTPQWEKLNDGTLYDKNSGRTISAGGSSAYRMLTDPAERSRYGIPEDDKRPYQIDPGGKLSAVGGASTNVNIDQKGETAFEQEAGKATAKRYNEEIETGNRANVMLGDINTMREISQRVGSQGSVADIKNALGPYAEGLGIKIDGLSDIQAFESIVQKLAPQMRVPGSGSTSDIEFKGMLASLPRLRNSPEAREAVLNTMEANARYSMQRAEIASKIMNKEMTRSEGEKLMRSLPDPMTGFRQFRKENPQLFQGPAPTASKPMQGQAGSGGAPVRVQTPDEARRLPKGTPIILPDGRQGVVP